MKTSQIPAIPLIFAIFSLYFNLHLLFSVSSFYGLLLYIFGAFSSILIGCFKKGETSIFIFLLCSLFFPQSKFYNSQIFSYEAWQITPYLFLQLISSQAITIHLIKKGISGFDDSYLEKFTRIILISVIIQFVIEIIFILSNFISDTDINLKVYSSYIELFSALVFFYGCTYFIKTKKHFDFILTILFIASLEMAAEALLYGVIDLPLPRKENVINYEFENKFLSLLYGDFTKLVFIQFAGVSISLYQVFLKRKFVYLITFIFQILPLILTFQRTPLISVIIIAVFYGWKIQKNLILKIIYFSFLVLFVYNFDSLILVFLDSEFIDFSIFKVNYFVIDQALGSGAERIGLGLRGLEVFISNFPFGIGMDYDRFLNEMRSSSNKFYFENLIVSFFPDSNQYYRAIKSGGHTTDTHNYFLLFLVQFGLLGLFVLLGALIILFRPMKDNVLFMHFGRSALDSSPRIIATTFLLACSFSFFFQSACSYFLLFFFIYFSRKYPLEGILTLSHISDTVITRKKIKALG